MTSLRLLESQLAVSHPTVDGQETSPREARKWILHTRKWFSKEAPPWQLVVVWRPPPRVRLGPLPGLCPISVPSERRPCSPPGEARNLIVTLSGPGPPSYLFFNDRECVHTHGKESRREGERETPLKGLFMPQPPSAALQLVRILGACVHTPGSRPGVDPVLPAPQSHLLQTALPGWAHLPPYWPPGDAVSGCPRIPS